MDFNYPDTGFVIPEQVSLSGSELANLAESAVNEGFESVWCSEEWGYSAFGLLSRVSERVSCPLGTCVVSAFSRTPATLAANALTLDEATGGKFMLGVGTSTPEMVEGFHGVSFEQPLRRVRETFEIVELGLAGDRMNYEGALFAPEGFRLNHSPAGSVPLLNAAIGPHNIAMSIEYADGIMPHMIPFSAIEEAVSEAEEHTNQTSDLHILPTVPACVSSDGEEARAVLANFVAYCLGSTRVFADVLSRYGFANEVMTVRDHWNTGDREAAADSIPLELIDEVGIAGTPERARSRFQELTDQWETVLVTCPHGISAEQTRTTVKSLIE